MKIRTINLITAISLSALSLNSAADCFENCAYSDSINSEIDSAQVAESSQTKPIISSDKPIEINHPSSLKANLADRLADMSKQTGLKQESYGWLWEDGSIAKSCFEYKNSKTHSTTATLDGHYWIDSDSLGPIKKRLVMCDMTTDGGGWTVVQYRNDGSVRFNRDWEAYKQGFGFAGTEYWIGNENLFHLTKERQELRIEVGHGGNTKHARYDEFKVGPENKQFYLTVNGFNADTSTLNDSFSNHNNKRFSTHDNDWDYAGELNCAEQFKSGWWFEDCFTANLNGLYQKDTALSEKYAVGVVWQSDYGMYQAIATTKLMIRNNPLPEKIIPQRLASN